MARVVTACALMLVSSAFVAADLCWKESYGRGVGEPITTCRNDLQKNGLLCYPYCNSGYYGVGPVCWQSCPSDFRDDGAFCFKSGPYGRGAGYALWNEDSCWDDNPSTGCEKWGLMWYPKCKTNFHNVACCICSPDCPPGMTDIGISCAKGTYGRGFGEPLGCAPGLEMSGALCYPPCKPGFYGVGPVCWSQCPSGKVDCGAICGNSDHDCVGYSLEIGFDALNLFSQKGPSFMKQFC